MEAQSFWPDRPRWVLPLQTAVLLLVLIGLWPTRSNTIDLLWFGYWIWLATVLSIWAPGDLHVMAAGVLAVPLAQTFHLIPLGSVEIKEQRRAWYLRWPEGRRFQARRLPRCPETDRWMETIQAANPEERAAWPRTSVEARQALAVGWKYMGLSRQNIALLALAAGMLIPALYWNQPLFLTPLLVLPWFMESYRLSERRLVLTRAGLWLVTRGQEPLALPLAAIRSVSEQGRQEAVIHLDHPDLPAIRLNRYRNADLLRLLRAFLKGDSPTVPSRQPAMPQAAAEPDAPSRCSLCGNPAGVETGVHICEQCALRTQFEAVEAGHGPAAKKPKPM